MPKERPRPAVKPLSTRLERAVGIIMRGDYTRDTDGRWVVWDTASSGQSYLVDPLFGCTCPDATIRGIRCKHAKAIDIVVAIMAKNGN
jgi:hypothetical protein